MGWNNISHDGATASYRAYLETFPELHLSIALLSNTSQFDIDNAENIIRRIFVTDKKENSSKEILIPECDYWYLTSRPAAAVGGGGAGCRGSYSSK